VTAQSGKQHRETLEVCVSTVSNCRRDQRTKKRVRDTAEEALAAKLAAGRKVLSTVLAADDLLRLDFITPAPGDLDRPDPVEDGEAEPGLPGHRGALGGDRPGGVV
jgi:hypothetical protein